MGQEMGQEMGQQTREAPTQAGETYGRPQGWMSTNEAQQRVQERFGVEHISRAVIYRACSRYRMRLTAAGHPVAPGANELACAWQTLPSNGAHTWTVYWIEPESVEHFSPPNRPPQSGEARRVPGRPLGATDHKPRKPKATTTRGTTRGASRGARSHRPR